jgi:hypothetical protein
MSALGTDRYAERGEAYSLIRKNYLHRVIRKRSLSACIDSSELMGTVSYKEMKWEEG